MAGNELRGRRVAILVTDGFEQIELVEPRKALDAAGAETRIVSPNGGEVRGWNHTEWGDRFPVDETLDEVDPNAFDALLLPGGVINPDKLRITPEAVTFARAFLDTDKPVAAICHGPWLLIEAGGAEGRRLTSGASLETDLRNAGADWVDEEVVVDRNVVTSRKPGDISAFNREMIRVFGSDLESRIEAPIGSGALP